jgi:serine protease Do
LVEAKKVGLNPDSTGDMKIKFVEITSKTLLKEGQVEFPAEINMDLPFEIGKSEIKDIFSDNSKADYIIVFDVALANVNRRIKKRNKATSIFLSGHNTLQNPRYLAAQMDVQNTRMRVQSANSQYCSPGPGAVWCELGKTFAVIASQKKLQERQQTLLSTSPTIKEPIHEEYEYSTSDMDVKKSLTAHFYVVNVKDKTYYKDTFDISESKSFTISYDVNRKDIYKSTLESKYDSEEDISSYEDKAIDVNVSMLLAHYLKNLGDEVKLKSEDELRMTMMYDKNQALTAYKERTYDARALNDSRFDHVVVIYNPTGSMGSGFYVTPDLVLTNYHVIEGAKYAEMKLYNGHETFGKVVKSDVRMDLALLKVQEKGKPVQFYDKNTLDLGSTTEAIGHPKGLEFTITRGVISAVRKRESVFDTGGKKVLFVQTDTPINPGNSGGPLFLGDKVIGVNDNKLVGMDTEGISFSIHHSEVEKFLKESF